MPALPPGYASRPGVRSPATADQRRALTVMDTNRRRWSRLGLLWRGFFCLLALPLTLVLVTGGPAAAEVYTTPSVGALIYVEGPAYGYGDMECEGTVSVVYVLPTSTEPGMASPAFDDWLCSGGSERSPYSCQPAEQGCPFKAWVKGDFCGGSISGDLGPSEYDGLGGVSGTFSGSYYAGDHRCDPASVCVRTEGGGSFREACTAVNLDPPDLSPTPPTACPWGDPGTLTLGGRVLGTPTNPTSNNSYFPFTWTIDPERVPPGQTDNVWRWYAGYSLAGGGAIQRTGSAQSVTYALGAGTVTITGNIVVGSQTNIVAGIGIFHQVSGVTSTHYSDTSVWNGTSGVLGATDAPECRFYRGTKWASSANDDKDEPLAPLETTGGPSWPTIPDEDLPEQPTGCTEGVDCTPSEEDEKCDFSLLDPTTWLEGGMCVVASGFGELIDAITGLVEAIASMVAGFAELGADIVSGILGGLAALFVPSGDFFDSTFDGLQADLSGGDVGEWMDAFTDAFDGTAVASTSPIVYSAHGATLVNGGSCQGVGFGWDKFEQMGYSGPIFPMAACGGITADVAGVVKLLLTGVVGIGAFLKCLGILSAALGFTKDTPRLQSGGVQS